MANWFIGATSTKAFSSSQPTLIEQFACEQKQLRHCKLCHLIKTAVLLPWRFFSWRRRREHWYLVEFCYFVSYMTLIGCFLALLRTSTGYESPLAEHAGVIFRVGFSFSTGMVLWSVFIFRNSIVLHDVDQLTSTFIHLSPPILFWCWRWGGGLGPSVVHRTWPGMLQICGEHSSSSW